MPKTKKKTLVSLEVRREWLSRLEDGKETVSQIAKKGGYDPRTVRKQIELARQDRERKEARHAVFRNALEQHYEDLIEFVKQLDEEVLELSVSVVSKQDRLWKALRQHLPRSPLWKAIDRLEFLSGEVSTIEGRLGPELQGLYQKTKAKSDGLEKSRLNPEGITEAVMHRIKIFEGEYTPELNRTTVREGEVEIGCGPYICATVSDGQIPVVEKFVSDLMTEASKLAESADMRLRLSQRRRVLEAIREELATIKLRRIVPGRCKYCPI
jgi:uncharacterized protein (UPF0335 family)